MASPSVNPFAPASVSGSWLRLCLAGPAGSGKTYSALAIASGIAPEGKVAVLDTEHGTASKYADRFRFDTLKLRSFEPERYIEAIKAAQEYGYDVLIIDSLSHAWAGKGGILEFVDQRKRRATNKWTEPWGEATPRHQALIEAILETPIHIIATMRSKMEYMQTEEKKVVKVGMAPVQRDGMEYEFDIIGELDQDNILTVSKSRYFGLSEGQEVPKPSRSFGEELAKWLDGDKPAPIPVTPPPPLVTGEKSMMEMPRDEFAEALNSKMRTSGITKADLSQRLGKPMNECTRTELLDALDSLVSDQEAQLPFGAGAVEVPEDIASEQATTSRNGRRAS